MQKIGKCEICGTHIQSVSGKMYSCYGEACAVQGCQKSYVMPRRGHGSGIKEYAVSIVIWPDFQYGTVFANSGTKIEDILGNHESTRSIFAPMSIEKIA